MQAEVREKTLRGLRTAWLQAGAATGAGPIVLLLHGFPDSAESWSHQIAHFSSEGTEPACLVIAPYSRGAGPSEKPGRLARYAPDAFVLDVLAILDEVDPARSRRICVVGHDLGAVHAWHVARALQGRAIGLAVINGLTVGQMLKRLRRPRQVAKSWYMAAMQIPFLPEALFAGFGKPLVAFAHKTGGLAAEQRPAFADIRSALRGPLNQYRAFLRTAPAALRGERRLACPLLVLWGKDDAFLLPPTKAELEADAEDVTIRILAGNHWLQREQPEKINRVLADFFQRAGAVAS